MLEDEGHPDRSEVIAVEVRKADEVEVLQGEAELAEAMSGGARSEAGVDEHGDVADGQDGTVATGAAAKDAEARGVWWGF